MARIIVQTDTDPGKIALDERDVTVPIMEDEHSSLGLIERIAWAVLDVEQPDATPAVHFAGSRA